MVSPYTAVPYYSPYTGFSRSSALKSPALETHGQPSDADLLKQYQPLLFMNPSDTPPVGFEELLRFSTLKQYLPNGQSAMIVQHPTLADLQKFNAPYYFLSFSPKTVSNALKQASTSPVIYGKVLETPRFKVLYYFYYFPDSGISSDDTKETLNAIPQGVQEKLFQATGKFQPILHQGDCEGVQVFLCKPDLKPIGLFAFEHYGGKSLLWNDVQRFQERPVVRLHTASHASHPVRTGEGTGNTRHITPTLRIVDPENELIFSWQGRIGNFHESPWMNQVKETLPSITAGYRGPVANRVTPWEVSLDLNAAQQPETAYYRYLHA